MTANDRPASATVPPETGRPPVLPDQAALADALERDNHLLLPGALDPASAAALVAGARDLTVLHHWHARLGPLLERLSRDWASRGGEPVPTATALMPPVVRFDFLARGQHRVLEADPAAAIGGSRLPFRFIALLARPGQDFEGGDLVLTERRPRMQSRAFVVPLKQGDGAIVVCGQRWRVGTRGSHAVEVKRGLGTVRAGSRLGVELAFDRQHAIDRQRPPR